jgi:hypothetical protein
LTVARGKSSMPRNIVTLGETKRWARERTDTSFPLEKKAKKNPAEAGGWVGGGLVFRLQDPVI